MINGVNDGVDEIEALAPLWSRQAILNMIPVNAVEGSPYKRPSAEQIERIKEACRANGILLKKKAGDTAGSGIKDRALVSRVRDHSGAHFL